MDDTERRIEKLEKELAELKAGMPEDKLSMVVMSGDLDKMLAAFIIATGASAMYEKVVMFFTFWAIPALKDPKKKVSKDMVSRMFENMLPKGVQGLALSRMNMFGMGKAMIKGLMKKHNVKSLSDLIGIAAEGGVEIYVCNMSMDLMGYKTEEMIDYPGIRTAGVAKFLAEAASSKVSLFV